MPRFGNGFRTFGLAVVLAAAAAGSAFPSRSDTGATISAVRVLADGGPAGAEIESLVRIAPGDAYSEKTIDAALKQIFQTGLFSDVRVLRDGETNVRLTFALTRKLLTRAVAFSGDRPLSRAKLRETFYSLRPSGAYSEERLSRAAEELRDALRKEGYLTAEVRGRGQKDPDRPFVDVTFDIAAGRRFTIRTVEVVGDVSAAVGALSKKLESRRGGPYVPAALDADLARIKEFYGTHGFPRADVTADPPTVDTAGGKVALTLRVVPNERVRITIRGANIPESLVRSIWEERVFEEWGLLQSESRIASYLRNQGYVFATVKSSLEKDPGELRIAHDVNPGRKYTINEVDFEGLHFFSAVELKKALGLGLNLAVLGGIEGQKLFEIPAEIRRLYETKGFPETRVDLNFRKVGADMRAIYSVEEGSQRTIGRITARGAARVDPAEVRRQILSVEGGPFYQPEMQRDVGRVVAFYRDQGFRGTTVTAAVAESGTNVFDVDFDIREGRRIKIERVVITGNTVTRQSTIDRELKVRAGDWVSADRIQESKRNLDKLGIFAEVRVEEIPVSAESENLVFSLREGERNYLSLGAGLETKTEPQSFEIWNNNLRPRGTAELVLGNLFGRASQLSLVTQLSLLETRVVAAWEGRYLVGLPLQTSWNVWLDREERVSYGYDQRGVSFSVLKSFSRDWDTFTMLRWTSTTLYFLDIAESQVDRQHYPYSATSISESVIRDRRDDSFNPTKGAFFSAAIEWAVPLFQAESNFVKTSVKYQRFFPVSRTVNFFITARAGLAYGKIPIHERFFAGGSSSFRGQPFDRLGPEDPTSAMPVGGKALLVFNFELTFPLFPTAPDLSGAAFYDKGNVFSERADFAFSALQDALGLGLRYRTPLGPVRLDFGWNLQPPEGRKQPIVFITIGNVF